MLRTFVLVVSTTLASSCADRHSQLAADLLVMLDINDYVVIGQQDRSTIGDVSLELLISAPHAENIQKSVLWRNFQRSDSQDLNYFRGKVSDAFEDLPIADYMLYKAHLNIGDSGSCSVNYCNVYLLVSDEDIFVIGIYGT